MNEPVFPQSVGQRRTDAARLATVWDQFYAHCAGIIRTCPSVRRLPASDREDCVQEVMIEIVRRFGEPRTEERQDEINGWIRVVSRNKAVDIARRRFRRPEVGFEDGSGETLSDGRTEVNGPGPDLERGEFVSLVWESLSSLDQQVPVTSYLVFYLRTIEGWDVPEIAALFQISTEQARARCHRVRKKFGSILRSKGGAHLVEESEE